MSARLLRDCATVARLLRDSCATVGLRDCCATVARLLRDCCKIFMVAGTFLRESCVDILHDCPPLTGDGAIWLEVFSW